MNFDRQVQSVVREVDALADECHELLCHVKSQYAQCSEERGVKPEAVKKLEDQQAALDDAQYHMDQALDALREL